jgi:tRNA pseudouridine32 synthase/23S rRNA pseudouridine746 synthase
LGIAIVGDPVYGLAGEPMLLHALAIRIAREGKNDIDAVAPLPDHFGKAGFSIEHPNG